MKRQAAVLSAALAVIGVGIAGASSTAQQPGPPTGTLELIGLDREARFKFVDNPPRRRESAGDQLLITQRLRNASNRRVGRVHASFVFAPGRRSAAQGSGTFVLRNGQIVVSGILDGRGRTRRDTLAIVGGSGAYNGARGTLVTTERRRSTRFLFTFMG
jgi:hypothetical protein